MKQIVAVTGDNELEVHVSLTDVYGKAKPMPVTICIRRNSVSFHFEGFGDHVTEDEDGTPVLVEQHHGVPVVYVWDDINEEDPTYQIVLDGADIKLREDAED
jgi:hypothetical protein